MQYTFKLCLALLLLVAPLHAQAIQTKTPSEITRQQSPAVVIIEALDERGSVIGQGSGFIVTPGGAVVTNLHVVQGAAVARVKLPSGDVYKTSDLVEVDDAKDLVVLKLKGFKLPTVTLGDSDKTEVGESVLAISSPEGLVNSLSTGVISGVRRLDTRRVFQITAPISRGSSGGALFNSSGEVIGVVTYVFKSGQNINFAVPINYVRGMIGDQVTTNLAKLPAAPQRQTEAPAQPQTPSAESPIESADAGLQQAVRGRLGRTQAEPMFVRPDEALSFFYRLVEGIGLYSMNEVGDLTRTAAFTKTRETDSSEEYTIPHLSFFTGLTVAFSKPERLLQSVEMLVTWSMDDVKGTFGDKFKRRKIGNQNVLDYGRMAAGHTLTAILDGNNNVRSIKFEKPLAKK